MQISYSPQNDNVNFIPKQVNSIDELVKVFTSYNYSTGTFKGNYRNKKNFEQANLIALDIDNEGPNDNYTIEGAAELFKDYKHVILPSKSHKKEKNGKVADRFRVILFLDGTVNDAKDFTATWKTIQSFYPAIDRACKDASRYYYPSTEVFSVNEAGKAWPTAKYVLPGVNELDEFLDSDKLGKVSAQTAQFFLYGAPEGRRNVMLFKAAKDMQEQGFSKAQVIAKLEAMIASGGDWATDYINEKDIECIDNAFKDDPMYPKRKTTGIRNSIFTFQTIDEMVEEAGEINWLAEGLLTEGGFSLMVGPPKAGKSTLVRQLVKSVCQGQPFLGRDITQGGVLYLTFEEQPAILKQQFAAVGIKKEDRLIMHVGNVFAEQQYVFDDIKAAIEEYEPSLVILDTLFDIVQLESINDYQEVKKVLAMMRTIARDSGSHIMGVHHTNKAGEGNNSIMGSNAIHGAVDTLIRFVQERERRYIYTNGKHGRHFSDQELVFDYKTQSYELGQKRERGAERL